MKARVVAVAVVVAASVAPAAHAAPWKRVTTPDGASTDQVADTTDALNVPDVFRRFRDVWSPCPRQESNLEPSD